jgi:hypothetical protein
METRARPLDRNHLSLLVAVVLLGNVLFRFIELPEATLAVDALGSPVGIQLTGVWVLVALMVGLVSTGTNFVIRDHPLAARYPERPVVVNWIIPASTAGLSAYLLSLAPTPQLWTVGLAAVGVIVSLAVGAEYTAVSPETPGYAMARLALNVLAYVLAFAYLTLIYGSRTRSLLSASGVAVLMGLLSVDLLSGADVPFRRASLYSLVVGLVMGESTWALNYWRIAPWAGGLVLLLVFYGFTNVAHQHVLGRLDRGTVVELVAIIAVLLAVVLIRAR